MLSRSERTKIDSVGIIDFAAVIALVERRSSGERGTTGAATPQRNRLDLIELARDAHYTEATLCDRLDFEMYGVRLA